MDKRKFKSAPIKAKVALSTNQAFLIDMDKELDKLPSISVDTKDSIIKNYASMSSPLFLYSPKFMAMAAAYILVNDNKLNRKLFEKFINDNMKYLFTSSSTEGRNLRRKIAFLRYIRLARKLEGIEEEEEELKKKSQIKRLSIEVVKDQEEEEEEEEEVPEEEQEEEKEEEEEVPEEEQEEEKEEEEEEEGED